ncbi:helix-turn-helix domain-containing protein [Bacillus sp. FJAT-49732]|uniref:Helix-turn-helix domain-containing protein n=1 Tax=Lederbergia citrisecunda TaxID=2833583 RepID=A0A942TSE8_9BACI|nr:helix-turn-helix domain-containing protein [Lederbergia citrisecunda]MBS4202077.1 helix-turn-helix domain-containing protein [Lederbergia citrisecunda]
MKKLEEIEYFCKLLFESVGVPIYFINEEVEVVLQFASNIKKHPLYEDPIRRLEIFSTKEESCIITSSPLAENYFHLKMDTGAILLGPTLEKSISFEMINGIMNDFQIQFHKKQELFDYLHSVPVMIKERLKYVGSLLYYFIYEQKLETDDVMPSHSIENLDVLISKTKQEMSFHYSYFYEKRLLQFIKEGNIEGLLQATTIPPHNGRFGTLSKKSVIRSEKNLFIAAITLATRAVLDGGVPSEEAYTVSDMYIQRLEELNDINAILQLRNDAILDFTKRVSKYKNHIYSKPILVCQRYIQKHLYEDITLGKLSSLVKMNASYLSQLFKKEVGTSLNEYILRSKVEEAEKLLALTDYSITEIYSLLNFYDQSHFSKVFKKYSGMTPKQYREKHSIAEID